ncbi:FAD-dependent oxidoreductase [Terriglobus roseus]|uniref:FAD dependent oxidoreductase n=1 Tax=Terriglobus roseus TaxID=392734 RepID=A0A1G7L328_9BACT|nr:FAD-dependent oxidoreductase [Terriglobus roseus]SDF43490.1 FAD dependent oxidoreductase [Terriglobus roseus]
MHELKDTIGATGASTTTGPRTLRQQNLDVDLVVVGGGLSGVCAAITAARQGVRTALVQDRPVLGGNASSEVRLWVLGATSHMGNNNRWAREGGVIDEFLVENMWRNPEGNAVVFDSILLEWTLRESNITLLLNTAVDSAETEAGEGRITSVSAFCSQNQNRYNITAPLFCDASGDGILGFLAGAAFRVGAESRAEFGELLAPETEDHSLLGHSLYFYTRDTGRPVKYVPPAFALKDITAIPRFRELRVTDSGCRLWWLEYGGARDTVYETEEIKYELWKVAYGVWNYIKNSGEFPEAETLTLEWMGTIPGKRESRRFEGDYMLTQQDVIEQRHHDDAVSFGGWAVDLHPPDGVYSPQPGCTQWHSKGVYTIPYRTMYSRNVPNLFLTGRILSASHIAFGSTRVMATCAHNAQAVGMAAVFCKNEKLLPRDLTPPAHIARLQQALLAHGQHIPGVRLHDVQDKAWSADITASSTLRLAELEASGEWETLSQPLALLMPLAAGTVPRFTLLVRAKVATELRCELWTGSREGNTTPDVKLDTVTVALKEGEQDALIAFSTSMSSEAHAFVMLHTNEDVSVALSTEQVTGILTLAQKMNKAVAKSLVQSPPEGSGVDTFAFWLPTRRPQARNLAMRFEPALDLFHAENVRNGIARPWSGVNAWLPAKNDARPTLKLTWDESQTIREIVVSFDTDFDHPMESVLMGHPERVMPACVTAFEVRAGDKVLTHVEENHQTRYTFHLAEPITTGELTVSILGHGDAIPAIFEVRCY